MDLEEIKASLLASFSGAMVKVEDLTGMGDHISITIESVDFIDHTLVEQHQMVYKVLGPVVGKELHAVAINTRIPKQNNLST